VLTAFAGFALFAWPGCSDAEGPKLCGEIPKDGCPAGRGGSCQDRLCAALFDCVDGSWLETERCPSPPATTPDAGPGDAGVDGSCAPVVIDHSGELDGCTPDLQEPDCPASAAEACEVSACLTGCIDFFLCTAQGWTEVAYCDDRNHVVVTP
jgi:hypothetical protein